MDWQLLFNIAGGSFIWFLVIRRVFGNDAAWLKEHFHWFNSDSTYHYSDMLSEHFEQCDICSEDEFCDVAEAIMQEWEQNK